jgi:hypothetical protein
MLVKKNNFNKNSQSGQTLILGVVAILILLLATIFIYDLASMIKTKVRLQSGVDAAAIAAANWQVESLNLIGEMNLVKACTVLVSGIPPFGDDSPEGLTASSETLTEMQARVSFVGPMIGFGAAQAAAKNNRIPSNSHYTMIVNEHIERLMDDDYYGEDVGVPQTIEGYSWRSPYTDTVSSVNIDGGGVAVAPNAEFAGLPDIDPSWLMDLTLYDAIAAQYWCHDTLIWLLKSYSFEGKWWDLEISSDYADFTEESEYLPLFTEFSDLGDSATFYDAYSYLQEIADGRGLTLSDEYDRGEPEDTDGINSPLPYVKWCLYESTWETDSPSSEWTDGTYLRSGLKDEYAYGGAVAKMTSYSEIPYQTRAYSVNNLTSEKLITVNQSLVTENPIESETSALAKPLGSLGDGLPPYLSGMVLPVFDKARLIPISMQDPSGVYDPFNSRLYDLYEFLQWLDTVDDIENPGSSPPAGGTYFLWCLQQLNEETWRSQGYNRNFVDTGDYPTQRYDPDDNPTGAGWLQMGYVYQYSGEEPIAILETNEDTCDDWFGSGPGPRDGPSQLH